LYVDAFDGINLTGATNAASNFSAINRSGGSGGDITFSQNGSFSIGSQGVVNQAGGNITLTGGVAGGNQEFGINLQVANIDSYGGTITLDGTAGTIGNTAGVVINS